MPNGESQNEILDTDVVQSLEDEVQYWTDYSKVHYHPQSLFELNGFWMNAQEFNNYGIGKTTLSEGQQGDEINERLRFFIEECDHVQVCMCSKSSYSYLSLHVVLYISLLLILYGREFN